MKSSYVSIRNFAPHVAPKCEGDNYPLTMCLTDTMDREFQNGSTASTFGARSFKCQNYMAERCAKEWDGYCEYFYRENGPSGQWPNNQPWPGPQPRSWEGVHGINFPLSTGEHLLRNTGERKFCSYRNCAPRCEPFDPMDPNSPQITYYEGECMATCSVDPRTIDADPVMNRMLENPKASVGTLLNICNTSKRQGVNLTGTKIGRLCAYYEQLKKAGRNPF